MLSLDRYGEAENQAQAAMHLLESCPCPNCFGCETHRDSLLLWCRTSYLMQDFDRALARIREARTIALSNVGFQCDLDLLEAENLKQKDALPEAVRLIQQAVEKTNPKAPRIVPYLKEAASLFWLVRQGDRAIEYQSRCLGLLRQTRSAHDPALQRAEQLMHHYTSGCKDCALQMSQLTKWRMCNRCEKFGKTFEGKVGSKYGKCSHCKSFYFCSTACASAPDGGLDAHYGVCKKAPDEIGDPDEKKCRRCRSTCGTNLKACARCRNVKYCSADCQRADWNRHKTKCAKKE